MADDPHNTNPQTGRSRSSTLSGSFGPIQPNPAGTHQQRHERRGSFLAMLLGVSNASQSGPNQSGPISSGSAGWSPASSVTESLSEDHEYDNSTDVTSVSDDTVGKDDGMKRLSASLGGLGMSGMGGMGSWGRAASWIAEKQQTAEPQEITSPMGLSRRLSMGPTFRRPFELPSYTSTTETKPDSSTPGVADGLSPLSRITSAPSAPDHPDGAQHEQRGRPVTAGWWGGKKKERTKRKLSPMGERMIRDSMFH